MAFKLSMKLPSRRSSVSSVPGTVARSLLLRLPPAHDKPADVVRRARLPYSVDEIVNGQITRLPRTHFVALTRECVAAFEDHVSREAGHVPWDSAATNMLCYCVINSETLAQAIERATEFCRLLGERSSSQPSLEIAGPVAAFYMKTSRPQITTALLSDLVGLSFFHRFFGWLIGEELKIHEVGLAYAESMRESLVPEFFAKPITLGVPANRFTFPATQLRRPVVRVYRELVRFLQFLPFDVMPLDCAKQPVSESLMMVYRAALVEGRRVPTLEDLAPAFCQSAATLRRHLADEHTSAQQVKEKCRRELAIELLRHSRLSVDEIAGRVGFSGQKSLTRAFKKWTGLAPSEFRSRRQRVP